jgi:cellulose synthase/poly-beta-1,6-N-acetylglucosamine synthase-like glycosyltransferase
MSTAVFLICFLLALNYIILIGFFTVGWFKKRVEISIDETDYPFISVIIPFRNEAPNLPALIQNLKSQDYFDGKFEILFSDDFSDDNSVGIISKEIEHLTDFQIIKPKSNEKSGKKAAIERALKKAKGDIIVNTDADCIMNPEWLKSIGYKFRDPELQMMLAPVDIDEPGGSIFSGFQSLEFMSLMGSTGGSANMGYPIMANGANMAIRRNCMLDAQGKIKGNKLLSGDDMFLLHAIKKMYPGKIRFLKSRKAIVKTKSSNTLKEFFIQRARWSSKSTAYNDVFTIFTGGVVAAINIFIVLLIPGLLFYPGLLKPLIILWSIKLIVDFPILAGVAEFMGKARLLWLYVPLQFLYPFYVTASLLLAVFTRTNWKGSVQN